MQKLTILKVNNVRDRKPYGFTLIEILVVVAISVILFGLLLKPLVDSLSLTKQAQITAAAQDSARKVVEIVTRELATAAYVSDNASHPIGGALSASAQYPADQYTNFLNLEIPTASGTYAVAHAYNAKLDVIMARRQTKGTFVDPTAGNESIQLVPGVGGANSEMVAPPDLAFPLSPGTTMIRYFHGLADPTKHYRNTREKTGDPTVNADNMYVLYRAQFSVYKLGTSGPPVVNTDLFDVDTNGSPELDDPDFFRYVTATDINWMDPTHAAYGASGAGNHNGRVDNWIKIAKPIIAAPEIDLLVMPHNSDGTVGFDDATGGFPGVAHYGGAYDPVAGVNYPVVHTSVTFRPAAVAADAAAGTTNENTSAGIPANQIDPNLLPYIPTVYTSSGKSWSQPYKIYLIPDGSDTHLGSTYYYITEATQSPGPPIGDLVEYFVDATGVSTPIYDITGRAPYGTSPVPTNYVPVIVNPDTGTINFDIPALPDAANPYNREWTYSTTTQASPWPVDLKALTGPTPTDLSPLCTSPKIIENAHLVPGSVQVYGPDMTQGSTSPKVMYTQIETPVPQINQYYIDYLNGIITLPANMPVNDTVNTKVVVNIIYDYQANMTGASPAIRPMSVKVDYATRDLINANIGVRYYDTNDHAQIVNVSSDIKVGNSHR